MVQNVIGLWRTSIDQFEEYYTNVYTNNTWQRVVPWVYTNGEWQQVGGAKTLYIPFILSDGKKLLTSDGKSFLVPNH